MANKVYTNNEKDDETIIEATNSITTDSEGSSPSTNPKPETSVPTIINPQITSPYFKISPSGDITIGDYDNAKGAKWDQSAGTFSVLGGVNISSLNIPDTVTADSFHVDTDGNAWWGATTLAGAVAKILKTGAATFTNVTATGTMNATGGYIGSTTALVYEAQGINCGSTGYIRGGQTDYNTGTGFFLGYSGGAYKFSIGSSTKYLTWDGTDLTISGAINHVAGDILYQSADTSQSVVNDTPMTKKKEVVVYQPGTYRIKFNMTVASAGTSYGQARIYKNGVAVGTLRTITGAGGPTNYSEDISGFVAGDLIQLYISFTVVSNNGSTTIDSFRLYVSQYDTSTVNLD